MASWLIRSERVVLPDGIRPATIVVTDGRIAAIEPHSGKPSTSAQGATADKNDGAASTIEASGSVVMPGLVDSHVHINDPGRADWEGFETATRAAAAGGITTLVDMPLNSIPSTTNVAALDAKRRAAAGRCHVDVGFWGGLVPGNTRDLEPLARAGVLGFKCFLSPSGVDEFSHVSEADLREAMPIIAATGLPLLVHAEWPAKLREPDRRADPRSYSTWLDSRPSTAEQAAIDLLIDLSARTSARVHIVHLASADALASIGAARAGGIPITVETCPHYLTFCAEDAADGDTALKCAPPIRERDHRERLWRALADGHIDLVATDHSPAPAALKHIEDGSFLEAWGGIASLQISLPIVWTGAAARRIPIERVAQWMSAAPARLAGLGGRKGAIKAGYDADLVIVDPDREMTVDASRLYHRHAVTPYDGARLRGVVMATMLRGAIVFEHGDCVGSATGKLIPDS
ncbi:MAG TPA: allantoinase AllB [Gemmatimonadaceae bacterium]|nr:allantoinase AllB [Gemmatimonadaceae bacterium]